MKVALVHDWLNGMRGGEKVLEIFCELFPEADIFTLLHVPGKVSPAIEKHKISTSFIQRLPLARQKYRYYLPLMPRAIESLNLEPYDLVVSSSHCVAKGCRPGAKAVHICCCFTPMRYIWDQYDQYFNEKSSPVVRIAMDWVRPYLQTWDVQSSKRVSKFIAISNFVAARIKKYLGRDSAVIYPPADTEFYSPGNSPGSNDFYLMVSALAPYKRLDIAIEAFNQNGRTLKIIGSGQSESALKKSAGAHIEFLGWRSNQEIAEHYRNCSALVFPGIEDYGIVPIEAMACGRPVIAYRAGGVLETVLENKTGLFFDPQTPESLNTAVEKFEKISWDSGLIRNHALKFSKNEFLTKITNFFNENA